MKKTGGGNRSSSNENSRTTFRPYGIGIDTHRDFIVVTVLIRDFAKGSEKKFQKNFFTSMSELTASRKWVAQVLKTYGLPISAEQPLHYTIEATACYHYPVLLAWEGEPSVVNPPSV